MHRHARGTATLESTVQRGGQGLLFIWQLAVFKQVPVAVVIKRGMQLVIEVSELLEHLQAQPDIGIKRRFGDLAFKAFEYQIIQVLGFLAQLTTDLIV